MRDFLVPPLLRPDGVFDGWTVVGSAVIDTGHLLAGPGIGANGAFPTGLVVDDFILEYKMNILSNSGTTETCFRTDDPTRDVPPATYMFSFRDNLRTVKLYKRNFGTWLLLQSTTFHHTLNTWHTVRIEVIGSSIRIFINGALVINVIDGSFSSGHLRLNA